MFSQFLVFVIGSVN